MKYIPLTKGKLTLVDDEDFEYLNQWKWCYLVSHYGGYAIRGVGSFKDQKILYMHRVLLDAPRNKQIDHINGNSLDNRRLNLRLCTSRQNTSNQRKHKDSKNKYKGIFYIIPWNNRGIYHKAASKKRKLYAARIRVNGKALYLGSFIDEDKAAFAYNEAAKKHFGEFARLNIIRS